MQLESCLGFLMYSPDTVRVMSGFLLVLSGYVWSPSGFLLVLSGYGNQVPIDVKLRMIEILNKQMTKDFHCGGVVSELE